MQKNIRFLFFVIVFGLMTLQAKAQSAGDYRSNVFFSGNWSSAGSWERFNGSAWVTATSSPSSADGVITILNGHRIDINTAITIDQVVVASGGQLFIFDLLTPFVCTLANGVGSDITVNGTLVVSINSTLSGAGTVINNSGGTFIVRNQGVLSVPSVNNGLMQVSGTGNFVNTTVTNNATFSLLDNTLNLNNATLNNKSLITFDSAFDCYIAGTGNGVFTNDVGGTLYKTSGFGTAWIDPAPGNIIFSNRGVIKGFASFIFRSTATNTGVVTPGNAGAASLGVNPVFVTGKSPTFELEIASAGGLAGITYDQVVFSNTDAASINISGSTLNVSDNATDAIGTVYTIFNSSSTITGTFATVHLSPTLGNLTYNANTITVRKNSSQNRYTWSGGNSLWTTAGNWTPNRTTPAATDILFFNSGGTVTVTAVPTETISAISITNNTMVNLQTATTSKTLTIGNGYMNYLNIDPGSSLHALNNAGIFLNVAAANASRVVVGGVADMQNGSFSVGNSVLQLHTTAVPLIRTSGQFTIGTTGSIECGDLLHTSGAAITLSNSIFLVSPSISSMTVCRTNGVVFGNQSITVNQAVMTLGNITTNSAGRILFSATATNPTESASSKIIGYAELVSKTVGTGALNFLGVSSPAGSDIGTVSLTRVNGAPGINTFNGATSIASTWVMSATAEPNPARTVSLSWLSDFDNGVNTSLSFQHYRYDGGPDWLPVGALSLLQSAGNPRTAAAGSTLKLTGSWTIADQNNVLPIVIASFDGVQVDHIISLNWETLTELHGDYFEVQRHRQSEESFSTIGKVRAHGNSRDVIHYTFEDEAAGNGMNYYRLKLVDYDQSFDYSSVIAVKYQSIPDLVIYPNPVTGHEVNLRIPEATNGLIHIYDVTGNKIISFQTGRSERIITLRDLDLRAGLYIVEYEGDIRLTKKMMVVR